MKMLQKKFIACIPALVLVVIAAILFIESGFFRKDPAVEVFPENRYEKTLTVLTDADYRPYSFFDADGNPSGHDVELINIVANEMQMNLDLRLMNWYEAIDAMIAGEADVLMTCDFSDTFQGVDTLTKCEPVSFDDFIVYSKAKIVSSDELYGKRIAIMRNGNVSTQIDMMNLKQHCVEYEDNRQAMQALLNDEVDCALMRQTVGTVLLQELGARGIEGYVSIGQSFMCFGMNKDDPELVAEINSVLEKLKSSGEMDRLREKWLTTFIRPYSFKETVQNNYWAVFLFCVLVVLSVTLFIISRSLKRRNEEEQYRNAQVVEQLAQDFGCVNYVELTGSAETDKVVNYRVSERLKALIPGWENEKYFRHKLELLCNTIVYPPDREQFLADVDRERVLEGLRNADAYFVNTRVSYGDDVQYYQLKFSPVLESGKIKAVVAGLHSVDEQTRKEMEMQQQLEEALSMAQSASIAKTTFLNNMSHDIRTPMNAIIGFTELAEKHSDEQDKVLDYLGKIDQSSKYLLSLINDVLDMSRIESGKMSLEEKQENLPEIISAIRDIVHANVQAKQHCLSVEMADITDENIICDRLRLDQVLLNILSNAIKYTPDGGQISMSITETEKKTSGYATYEFRIIDNGIGMDEEFLKTIYDPFTRVRSSTVSGIQGTGLGMAITKNIVDMMGGTIDIQSEPGKGTEMILRFEFMLADSSEQKNGREWQSSRELDFTGRKVLLVEDNPLNREIALELLSDAGLDVETAENGRIAVDSIIQKGISYYDFILMDIQMPVMDGYEATKKIRELYPDTHIPIIALSANAFAEDKEASTEAGMDDHVAKPIDVHTLYQALAKFI